MPSHIIHPIPPVFDTDSRILILGSFPSVKSRESCFFYGHPQNLASILDHASIQAIYTNGGLSGKMYDRFFRKQTGIEAIKLPSTSPANAAWNLDRLTDAWKCINQILGEPGSETKNTVSDGNAREAKTRII